MDIQLVARYSALRSFMSCGKNSHSDFLARNDYSYQRGDDNDWTISSNETAEILIDLAQEKGEDRRLLRSKKAI